MESAVRRAAVAGSFYEGNREILAHELAQLLESIPPISRQQPKAIIAPHAGYIYSGHTAAAAYARLKPWRDAIHRVVLLGPCHRTPVRGLAASSVGAFLTPLKAVPVDQEAQANIASLPQVSINDQAHAHEHSLEVQIPFLQSVLESFSLIPLVVGHASAEEVAEVLETLWGNEETLIVVSSDLSHFLPYPSAQVRDRMTCKTILDCDHRVAPEEACGAYPINGLLLAAIRHHLHPELVELCNSGDTAGDKDSVVGYASFAFYPESSGHA